MNFIKITITLILFVSNAYAGSTIFCSHEQLSKIVNSIAHENKMGDLKTETLVTISGDPHEFEPSSAEIKKLINAPLLLTGPNELNPWIKKINFQRSKIPTLKTINLTFDSIDYALYADVNGEALSHFWLYPKVYCSMKSKLISELLKLNFKIKKNSYCDSASIETDLKNILVKIKLPIILTHDALLPLMINLVPEKKLSIVAIKGSGHHEEASPQSIKKMYDVLKFPKVIWVIEKGINIPPNIMNKIRSTDILVQIDSANSLTENPFSALYELTNKLKQFAEK
jgi:ABC-type Zn uptake system ZnuABC Zn-binding protein ZnuA